MPGPGLKQAPRQTVSRPSSAPLAKRGAHDMDAMAGKKPYRIAILWRGDREGRRAATPQNNRFHRVFEELTALGIQAEPAVYDDDIAGEVREQLLAVEGVLVWVDPIDRGRTRAVLDAMLRDIAT